jgi:GH18 family chitinase
MVMRSTPRAHLAWTLTAFLIACSASSPRDQTTDDATGDGDGPVGDGDQPAGDGDSSPGDGDHSQGDGDEAPDDGEQASPDAGLPGHGDGGVLPPAEGARRVVGYLPARRGVGEWAGRVSSLGLTHVMLAFANPGDDGQPALAASDEELAQFVEAAHAAGTKVLVSIGGGGGSGKVAAAFAGGKVDAYVEGLADYLSAHELDGLDVDVEGESAMTDEYAVFVGKMSEAVHGQGKLLTSALATWFISGISDQTLAAFDFINLMSYDHCGPWTDACEQSTYDAAVQDLDAFVKERNVASDRVVLGVPFYAYCWGDCEQGDYTYAELIERFPEAAEKDWIDQDGYQISYNGRATMERKVELARGYGGVMIWELGQDAAGDDSLLGIITGK